MLESLRKEFPFFAAVPALLWQCIFALVPLIVILVTSFRVVGLDESVRWAFDNYLTLCTHAHAIIILRSLLLASATALLCLVIGYPVAYFLALYAKRWRSVLLFFLTLPFWTNFLTLAYAWFFVLEKNGLLNRILIFLHILNEPIVFAYNRIAVVVVMVYCFLPFMIMPLYTALEKLDKRLLEASEDLGATTWQTFLRITLPLSISGIKTGLLLVFIPAFGEFVIPLVMGGSHYLYVGSTISYYMLHAQSEGTGAAFTVVSGVVLVAALVVGMLYLKSVYHTVRRR
jgi:spermidine/putrescine transport system permease protein